MRAITLGICILTGILILSAIVVLAGNSTVNSATEVKSESVGKTLSSHAPIYIDGNTEFTMGNGVSAGDGTELNPYIIENWNIDASTAHGVDIENTYVYFIVRNCVAYDGGATYYGIYFDNVTNGKIVNCTVYDNNYGICLDSYSNGNTISASQIYNNNYGIHLYHSTLIITSNQIYNNNHRGIYLSYSTPIITSNQIYNNEIGVELWYSLTGKIYHNNIYNNTEYGIYNWNDELPYQADATYNWWGSASGPYYPNINQDGTGNRVSAGVLYDPWLTSPVSPENEKLQSPPPKGFIPGFEAFILLIVLTGYATVGIRRKKRKASSPPQPPSQQRLP